MFHNIKLMSSKSWLKSSKLIEIKSLDNLLELMEKSKLEHKQIRVCGNCWSFNPIINGGDNGINIILKGEFQQ